MRSIHSFPWTEKVKFRQNKYIPNILDDLSDSDKDQVKTNGREHIQKVNGFLTTIHSPLLGFESASENDVKYIA